MTIHTKTALILLGTLIIGIVCGALISGAIRVIRQDSMLGPPSPGWFAGRMERIIRPDTAQQDAINRILGKYEPRFRETMNEHRAEMQALLDSLQQELDPVLTEEQRKRLHERRMPGKPFRGRRNSGGPPPHPE